MLFYGVGFGLILMFIFNNIFLYQKTYFYLIFFVFESRRAEKINIFFCVIKGGVFLMLGYSSTDEALLRPHTNLGVTDAVRSLHHYLHKHISNNVSN